MFWDSNNDSNEDSVKGEDEGAINPNLNPNPTFTLTLTFIEWQPAPPTYPPSDMLQSHRFKIVTLTHNPNHNPKPYTVTPNPIIPPTRNPNPNPNPNSNPKVVVRKEWYLVGRLTIGQRKGRYVLSCRVSRRLVLSCTWRDKTTITLYKTRQAKARLGKAEHDKTGQDWTRQDRTR